MNLNQVDVYQTYGTNLNWNWKYFPYVFEWTFAAQRQCDGETDNAKEMGNQPKKKMQQSRSH